MSVYVWQELVLKELEIPCPTDVGVFSWNDNDAERTHQKQWTWDPLCPFWKITVNPTI